MASQNRGFSLVEAMLVIAIIAILAAVAIPSYQKHLEQTRRTQAQADLLELSQWLQRHYSGRFDFRSVNGSAPQLPFDRSPRETNDPIAYNLGFVASPSQNGFQLSAIPTSLQSGDSCGTLTVAHTGARSAEAENCW